jgi:hypothetical protein
MPFAFVNPIVDTQWNVRIREFPDATFFHTAEWARVLAESYGYTPGYAIERDEARVLSVLPLMEVESIWTGKRAVSLPFSDECPPLLVDNAESGRLLEEIQRRGSRRAWRYIEWRGGASHHQDAILSDEFATHHLDIGLSEDAQLRKLRDSTRRNIQKSEREGVRIEHRQGIEATEVFYSLHCQTRRRHGLPPQPVRFFRKIHQFVLEPGHGFLSLARFNDRWIAGAVYFKFGSHAIYKFGASDPRYQHLRANNLLMWDAICRLQKEGIRELSFGRTDLQDEGLLQFKRGWGAEESSLRYYRLNLSKKRAATKPQAKHEGTGWSRHVMRRLPIPVLRFIGTIAYRHVA